MNRRLLASPTHTAVVLAIVGVVTALAIQTAASASSSSASSSRIAPYLVLIALQLLWVRYIHVGLKAKRHALSTLTGARWTAHTFLLDLAFGAVGFFAARIVAESVKAALGGGEANTAFLLPQGVAESALWVLVSCTAGVCEEIVFRGYLQRQLAALTGSVAAGILLQALAFGVSHGYQGRGAMAITGSYGLTLGFVAWWRGNVRAGALAHAVTDIVGGLTRF